MAKKSIAVLGLGKFGSSVARECAQADVDVLAIDVDEDRVNAICDEVTCAVACDVCDTARMMTFGLSNMDAVVVAITGNLHASVMATILAKEAGVPMVLAKSGDAVHTKILQKLGADRVIIPESESGRRVAHSLLSGKFVDFIELSERIRLIEMLPRPEWVGKSLRELNLRKTQSINVVAVRRGDELIGNLDPEKPLPKDCTMIIMVDRKDIARLTAK